MSASVTIIVVPAADPDAFEAMDLEERRDNGGGWKQFPVGSGRYLDTFLMKATKCDLGVMECEDHTDVETNLIDRETLVDVLPALEALVEESTDATAAALREHGKNNAALPRVLDALTSGAWPEDGDPAVEAAAFTNRLLFYARSAKPKKWEYRGSVKA